MVDRITNSGMGPTRKPDSARTNESTNTESAKTDSSRDLSKAEQTSVRNTLTTVDTGLVSRTQEEVNASDGIDRAKVEAIKTAIRNGEFSIDAKAVAKAFVNLEMMA
ncbi:flagellar biosynthesis anti-sigma factor FlgM [Spongiibacter sp. KMU-158]|uniref:Negative regulator of flagellin synthesis n=1 Tax=Spongiibacter pelagi TaxID=2760804 RepID=A0A927GWG6_9GAMM|nr:flagellar biosynthesis anti-sigma factor FlgM [Spongiibacter pelagi]MBD2858409.1 flagellar biosynthesis anti-sigma factor FlgM [Spongiibacter pelagi]